MFLNLFQKWVATITQSCTISMQKPQAAPYMKNFFF